MGPVSRTVVSASLGGPILFGLGGLLSWSLFAPHDSKARLTPPPAARTLGDEGPRLDISQLDPPVLVLASLTGEEMVEVEETQASEPAPQPEVVAPPGVPFEFASVIDQARVLSQQSFKAQGDSVPDAARKLNYNDYRRIEFDRNDADWQTPEGGLFQVHYDVRGSLFEDAIKMNFVEDGRVVPRTYDPAQFNFFDLPLSDEDKARLNFAGFRVTTPLNASGKFDEVMSFKGASFFRMLGAGTNYGASARGLAISTGSTSGDRCVPVHRRARCQHRGRC